MRFDCGPTEQEKWQARRIARELKLEALAKWHPWFAWRPIRVGPRECVWLETIERRGYYGRDIYNSVEWFWDYRAIDKKAARV